MASVPIHQVRADGSVAELGEWVHAERRLILHREGFPLLGPGDHRLESELPWVFWDMCPTGYMARGFLQRARQLALPPEPRLWTAGDCLRALTEFGSDLFGQSDRGLEIAVSLARTRRFSSNQHRTRTVDARRRQAGRAPRVLRSVANVPSSSSGARTAQTRW